MRAARTAFTALQMLLSTWALCLAFPGAVFSRRMPLLSQIRTYTPLLNLPFARYAQGWSMSATWC